MAYSIVSSARKGIDVGTSIYGPTLVGAIIEKVAFLQTDDSNSNPDNEIVTALKPALVTTRGPLILISSPYARRGILWDAFHRSYGHAGDPLTLVVRFAACYEAEP
jgi:hypothetical protein